MRNGQDSQVSGTSSMENHKFDSRPFHQPLENVFLDIMKQLSDEQKSPLDIAKNIVERTAHLVKAEICTWFRVTSDRQKLVLVAAYGTKSELVPAQREYDLQWDAKQDEVIEGLTAWIAVRGEEFSANSFRQLSAHRSHRGVWDDDVWGHRPVNELKSWFGVPLRLSESVEPKDSVIGVLKVERSTDEPFSEEDKYIVRLMARYIAISLEYRNTITAKFLQQVGHPLWGAMQTIIRAFKDSLSSCEQLLHKKELLRTQNGISALEETVHRGLVHASFVNQSMTAIKKLVLASETDNGSMEKRSIDLLQLVEGIVQSVQELADAQSAQFPEAGSFHFEIKKQVSSIAVMLTNAQEDAIRTIITELLYNSLKHARTGPKATITLEESDNMIVFRVRDYGKGIPEEDLQHIFDEGFHKHARYIPEGMGFGLTMIRSLTQRFGWPLPEVLDLKKRDENGVEFVIRLPNQKGALRASTNNRR